MAWARLDDTLATHPKIDDLPDELRLACIGVWTLALSSAVAHLTDGYVRAATLRRLGCEPEHRDALIRVGLWKDAGDGAIRIHDFLDFNPSRAEVEARRAAETERKRRQRAAGSARSEHDPDSGQFVSPDLSLRDTRRDARRDDPRDTDRDSRRDSRGLSPATRPVPSHPVPSQPASSGEMPQNAVDQPAPRDDDALDQFWSMTGHYPSAVAQQILDEALSLVGGNHHRVIETMRSAWAVRDERSTLAKRTKDLILREVRQAEQRERAAEIAKAKAQREPVRLQRATPEPSDDEAAAAYRATLAAARPRPRPVLALDGDEAEELERQAVSGEPEEVAL